MKITNVLAILSIMFTLVSCGNEQKQPTDSDIEVVKVETKEKRVHESAVLEAKFKDPKVSEVYQSYNLLKTSLVNTNAETTAEAATQLVAAYANVGVDEAVITAAQTIVESTDIKVQRDAFVQVTADVEQMMEGALSSGAIYKQFCPMAFNNTGAYWLSNTKEIRNPYFGDMMLKCGRVDKTIE